jgi:hypothetical protein
MVQDTIIGVVSACIAATILAPRFKLSSEPSLYLIFGPKMRLWPWPDSRREASLLNPPLESGVVADDVPRL